MSHVCLLKWGKLAGLWRGDVLREPNGLMDLWDYWCLDNSTKKRVVHDYVDAYTVHVEELHSWCSRQKVLIEYENVFYHNIIHPLSIVKLEKVLHFKQFKQLCFILIKIQDNNFPTRGLSTH